MTDKIDTEIIYRNWKDMFNKLDSLVSDMEIELVFTNSKAQNVRNYESCIRLYAMPHKHKAELLKVIDFTCDHNLKLKTYRQKLVEDYLELKDDTEKGKIVLELLK